jgi:hypothetical protein
MSYETADLIWNVYVRRGMAYIPDVALTDAGFNLDVEPVRVVEVKDVTSLANAISSAMSRGNPEIRAPARLPKPVILGPAGVKSWAAFEREGAVFAIFKDENEIEIVESEPTKSGAWTNDPIPEFTYTFPKTASAMDIAQFIAMRVGKRPDLQ